MNTVALIIDSIKISEQTSEKTLCDSIVIGITYFKINYRQQEESPAA